MVSWKRDTRVLDARQGALSLAQLRAIEMSRKREPQENTLQLKLTRQAVPPECNNKYRYGIFGF